MKLRIPGFRNTRAKIARRATPVLRFLAAPRRAPLRLVDVGGGPILPATSYVSKLRGYSTNATGGSGAEGPGKKEDGRVPLRRMCLSSVS